MRKLLFVLGLLVLIIALACFVKQQKSKEVAHTSYVAIIPQPMLAAERFPVRITNLPVPTGTKLYLNQYSPKVRAQCRSET
jgi:hypothetical protein